MIHIGTYIQCIGLRLLYYNDQHNEITQLLCAETHTYYFNHDKINISMYFSSICCGQLLPEETADVFPKKLYQTEKYNEIQ